VHGFWQCVSRPSGGSVTALASAPRRGLVFATTPVGVFRSANGGSSWELPAGVVVVPLASAIALSPCFEQDRTLFGCAADGLYRSSDGGDTWQRVLIGDGILSVALTVDEPERGVVVVVGTEADGILRSDDTGRTWTGANAGLVDLTAISLAVSPCFASDHTAFAGTASGIYRTRNGVRSWRSVETALDDAAVQCLLVSPAFADDGLVLAGTEADGLLRSVDGGSSWECPSTLDSGSVTALACTGGTIAAATERGIAMSRDAGQTWRAAETGLPRAVLSLAFVGDDLLVGLHQEGVVRSRDGGVTWEAAQAGLSARLDTQLALSPDFQRDRAVFVAGPEQGVRVSTDGGASWEDRSSGLASVMVNGLAAGAGGVWVATADGVYVSQDHASTWQRSTAGDGTARIVAVGSGNVAVVSGRDQLVVSHDAGSSWCELRPPVEASEIVELAIAGDGSMVVATNVDGELTLWRWDHGRGWSGLLVEPWRGVGRLALAVSPGRPVEEYLLLGAGHSILRLLPHTVEVHGRQPPRAGRSTALGSDLLSVTSMAASPVDDTVFVATNAGVFVSRDAGESFADWSEGLTNRRVLSVAVSPTDRGALLVYALGLGGTLWRRTCA
jgi:hypothetical protein